MNIFLNTIQLREENVWSIPGALGFARIVFSTTEVCYTLLTRFFGSIYLSLMTFDQVGLIAVLVYIIYLCSQALLSDIDPTFPSITLQFYYVVPGRIGLACKCLIIVVLLQLLDKRDPFVRRSLVLDHMTQSDAFYLSGYKLYQTFTQLFLNSARRSGSSARLFFQYPALTMKAHAEGPNGNQVYEVITQAINRHPQYRCN